MSTDFDPASASLAPDPDGSALAEWVKANTPGVKASDRQAAADGIIAAFKGGMDPDSGAQQILQSSLRVLPLAVRKGIRREFYRAQTAAKHAGVQTGHKDAGTFFAQEAPRILHERFTGRGSWRAQAKNWLQGAVDHVSSTAGIRADDPLLTKLTSTIRGKEPK